jgi:hypothetical protein
MKTVILKKNRVTKQLYLQGDFHFKISNTFVDNSYSEPYKEITFKYCPSSPFNLDNDEAIEMLGEKLKQYFKKLLRNYKR